MKRNIYKICILLFFTNIALFFGQTRLNLSAAALPIRYDPDTAEVGEHINLKLYALSAVLMDANTGRILYERDGSRKMSNASTTKIMTCIVALEQGNLDDIVTTSAKAASQPKVRLGVKKGETYRLKDLLYSLMLESHNDVAVAIAEHVGGSVEGFAALMNEKAKELGCTNTYFITPNGLDAEDENGSHSTTASELARMLSYCIKESPKNDMFLEITRTSSYSFTDVAGKRSFYCSNHNAFLNMMDGAVTGKTGFTGKAGYCYVGALERGDRTFVVALLGCGWPNNKSYKWSDTRQLMNYGLEYYKYRSFDEVTIDQTKLIPAKVENGQTDQYGGTAMIGFHLQENLNAANTMIHKSFEGILMRDNENIELVYQLPPKLSAPIEKGKIVGKIQYFISGNLWKVENIVTDRNIEKIDYEWCLEKLFDHVFP